MCGIVSGISQIRNITPILIHNLKRVEYRGYDSAGIAVIDDDGKLSHIKISGKIKELEHTIGENQLSGKTGIAHTRWATHGKPSIENAHPHVKEGQIALVHNGIIENHEALKAQQIERGHQFTSETDSEVIVNDIYDHLQQGEDIFLALTATISLLEGSYALSIISERYPNRLLATCHGSPLVVGIGNNEYFIASDMFALLNITQQFIFLQDGDIVDIDQDHLKIYDKDLNKVERPIKLNDTRVDVPDKGGFRHYMLKEIYEQPTAISHALADRLGSCLLAADAFDDKTNDIFDKLKAVQIVACGTSYHAGLIAKYWIEQVAHIPCQVEVASEFRYRDIFVHKDSIFISISQSGETADTIAALKKAKNLNFLATLAICNVSESTITRKSDVVLLTKAGTEIGVASTKAFTTQLTVLLLLVIAIARRHGMDSDTEKIIVSQLQELPAMIDDVLGLNDQIKYLANQFINKHHALYLGRGVMLPIAMEGALKLKETSYIHAEAYPAGELKHGPLALVDDKMPVIVVAPNDVLLGKLKSNLNEIKSRGGKLYIVTNKSAEIESNENIETLRLSLDKEYQYVSPVIYTLPLQLLSYHIAVLKGADVDQPRNLAKSVTVE